MKPNTIYLALGLAGVCALVSVSCGGDSETEDTNTSTAGSGGSGMAGSDTAGGTTSKAGTDGAGGTSAAGASSGGVSAAGAAMGGAALGGAAGAPDLGSAGAPPLQVPTCNDGVADGEACTRTAGENTCQLDETTYCRCTGQNNPTWRCADLGGAGGAGGLGDVTCPASAMTGNQCTGTGQCPSVATCACVLGTVICAP